MKYLRLTLDYLIKIEKGKHFFGLMLFAIIPCLGFAYFLPMTGLFDFLINYPQTASSYPEFIMSFLYRPRLEIGIFIGSAVLAVLSLSAMITFISRNLRVGTFKLTETFDAINENFFPALYAVGFYVVSLVVEGLLLCLFLFFWQTMSNVVLGRVLSVVFCLGSLILICIGYTLYSVWVPIMSFNGIKPTIATRMSYTKTRIGGKDFFVSHLLPVAGCLLLGLCGYFCRKIWYAEWLINAVAYASLMTFMISQSMLTYFDVECITREDLARFPFYRRG